MDGQAGLGQGLERPGDGDAAAIALDHGRDVPAEDGAERGRVRGRERSRPRKARLHPAGHDLPLGLGEQREVGGAPATPGDPPSCPPSRTVARKGTGAAAATRAGREEADSETK
ncbi:MAG: hypothetical protein R3263_11120, partial [Myxococcota bacterium]|nr:hypothetical protein [Myxococcota bacterium]